MRIFARFVLIALVAMSSFAFLSDSPAEAGIGGNSFFNNVTFSCPNVINFAGQWEALDFDDAYVRAWDPATGDLLGEEMFTATILGINNFSSSFVLANPLPATALVELWQGFAGQPVGPTSDAQIKPFGLAELFNPPSEVQDAGSVPSPVLPPGQWFQVDGAFLAIPNCVNVPGCDSAFTIYGTALVLDQQLGYSEPNGEPARDMQGNLIWVLHDVDQDGADTYLIVDIQTGADGETWLGIFIGSCDPVYVPLNRVYPLNAIPVD